MRQVRDRIYRLLDGRLRLREQADLYFLAGCINGLMGLTANRLATVSRTAALFLTRCGAVSSALRSQRTASALVRDCLARPRPVSVRKSALRDRTVRFSGRTAFARFMVFPVSPRSTLITRRQIATLVAEKYCQLPRRSSGTRSAR